MITASNLTKRYGRVLALDDFSFNVGPGEAVALWGANGAGKTTALRCVLGLLRHRGAVRIGGIDIRRRPKDARRLVGYVPQELAFHDDMRVAETMRFYARLRGADRGRIPSALESVDLLGHARKRVRELSGGMKQRLALALTLLSDPPALLLDEPTSNLDAAARADFAAVLAGQKVAGKTILFTSHRLDEVEAVADRVVAMERGRTLFERAPTELAETLGMRCSLQVFLARDRMDEAVRVLQDSGLTAQRNGTAVYVQTALNRKAEPILALSRAQIPVLDFEITGDDGVARAGSESRPTRNLGESRFAGGDV